MCLPVCLCVCSHTRLTEVLVWPQVAHQLLLLSPVMEPTPVPILVGKLCTVAKCEHRHSCWGVWLQTMCSVALRRSFFLPQCSQSRLHFLLFDTTRSVLPAPLELPQYITERERREKNKHILCIFTLLVNETMALFCIYKYVDSLTAYNNPLSPLLSVSPRTSGDLKRDFVRGFDSSSLGVWHFAFYLLCHHVWPRGI